MVKTKDNKEKSRKIKKSGEDYLVDIIAYAFVTILAVTIILPFLQVITISVSPSSVVNAYGFHLYPKQFDFSGYKRIVSDKLFWHSYLITILRTVIGTSLAVFCTAVMAYPLSIQKLPYRSGIMKFIVFTMYFSGGLIPTYLLIRGIGLYNNFLVYIIPSIISAYNLIIIRNYYMSVPRSLEESAEIDGATGMQVLIKIMIPLSKPVLATVALWVAVGHWNSWQDNMIYVTNKKLFVSQYVLQMILKSGQTQDMEMTTDVVVHTETMKMAALVLTMIPIVCVYPFVQKYFVKGIMMGSLKG